MKKILFSLIVGLSAASVNAQINIPSTPQETIVGENAFMDVSPYSSTNGWTASESKGLAFPETDLTQFRFKTDNISPAVAATAYNGMIVYNTATGTTADPAITTQTANLSAGFYYFYNPTGASTLSVTAGRWLPLGASPKVTIGTNEVATNTIVNVSPGVDKQVYAIKGSFAASGSSTAVNIPAPNGMTTMYAITIYKSGSGVVYDRSLYSYNVVTTAGNAVTGSPNMSVVYPNGTYDYVLEYLK